MRINVLIVEFSPVTGIFITRLQRRVLTTITTLRIWNFFVCHATVQSITLERNTLVRDAPTYGDRGNRERRTLRRVLIEIVGLPTGTGCGVMSEMWEVQAVPIDSRDILLLEGWEPFAIYAGVVDHYIDPLYNDSGQEIYPAITTGIPVDMMWFKRLKMNDYSIQVTDWDPTTHTFTLKEPPVDAPS